MLSSPQPPPQESTGPPAGQETARGAFRPTGWALLDNLLMATLDSLPPADAPAPKPPDARPESDPAGAAHGRAAA
ncbi:hypothetical protein KNE206_60830 [Kitasatospora sp. NE20-6]